MLVKREVEAADTLPREPEIGGAFSGAGPPVGNWERYELGALLGKGGMGAVYKARDRRLDRTIAIKFLLGADPNLTRRFLQEAHAQAHINHPNICRVYDAGEVDGKAYIALQFIDGESLNKAAAQMSLDEKIAVLRDVAMAVHEAHRRGIVHRDLKPANVMVERIEDGRWFPIVMDFGLARGATLELGITESGVPLGTPAYMSPEQARGDIQAIDQRSDVYSLGATLYELLTGSLPFPATTLATALAQAIHDDPAAPCSLVPSLPVDLETIALKCLAKDPAQRYPSARALAEDLDRYRDGEPILGRRLSLWQRARLRARHHRALVVLGAWSLAIIVALAVLGMRAWIISRSERSLAAERTRLAERLGRLAKDIELSLQVAYQLPLHDTRQDRDRIRAQMRSIRETHHDLGDLGDAVVHDALGRGHLALHQWGEAADELARAEAAGLNTPELHAARGRALGELYHRELEQARRSDDKPWLARRHRELVQQYLAPARLELESSRASGDDSALLAAQIAFYRDEFSVAENLAHDIVERSPWRFEASKLAADAAYGAAFAAFDRGDYAGARSALERATTLYTDASEIARSDPSLYEAAAQTWLQRAEIEFRQGRSPREPLARSLVAIDLALRADPDEGPAHTTRAYVLLRRFRTPSLAEPGDQRTLLDQIAQAAARAVEIDPLDARAWDGLGSAHIFRGIYESGHGGQAPAWWNRALDELGAALLIQPDDLWINNDVGAAHRWLGAHNDDTGGDPTPEYQAALRSFERASAIDPLFLNACTNQADIHALIAEHDYALATDPRAAVDAARRAGERCLVIDPNFYSVLDTLAQAQLTLARYLVETRGDPSAALAAARSYLDRADAVQPGNMVTWFYRAVAASSEAKRRLRDGDDPASAIASGHAAIGEALRLRPDSSDCYVEAAHLDLIEAEWAGHAGHAAAPLRERALADARQAIALDEQFADARLVAAEACLQTATAQRSRAVVEVGIGYVDQALALNPRLRGAQEIRAALLRLRAP